MFKFLFKSIFLGFVEAPVGVYIYYHYLVTKFVVLCGDMTDLFTKMMIFSPIL